jgi:hypothetical protein
LKSGSNTLWNGLNVLLGGLLTMVRDRSPCI